jgi:hypothetical protein
MTFMVWWNIGMASQALPSLAFVTASLFSFAALKRAQVQQLEHAENLQDIMIARNSIGLLLPPPLWKKRSRTWQAKVFLFQRTNGNLAA